MFRFRIRSLLLLTLAIALAAYLYVAFQRYKMEHVFVSVVEQSSGTPITSFRYRTTIRTERGQTSIEWKKHQSKKAELTIAVPIHCMVWLELETSDSGAPYVLRNSRFLVSPDQSHEWKLRAARNSAALNRNEPLTSFRLVDIETKQPIANAQIYSSSGGFDERPIVTKPDGSFRNKGSFLIYHPDYERAGTIKGDTLELERCKRLQGIVVDPNGNPIPNCVVERKKVDAYDIAKFNKTDGMGQFLIALTHTEIRANNLEIQHKGYLTQRVVTETNWEKPLIISLKPTNHSDVEPTQTNIGWSLRGRVLCNTSETKHLRFQIRKEHEVSLRRLWVECPCSRETQPDDSGVFVFQNLDDGHHELSIHWKDQILCRRPVIIHGEDVRLPDLKLPDRGRIRGSLASIPMRSTAFEELWCCDRLKSKVIELYANQNGEFMLDELLPGKWFVGEGRFPPSLHGKVGCDIQEILVESKLTSQCDFVEKPYIPVPLDSYIKPTKFKSRKAPHIFEIAIHDSPLVLFQSKSSIFAESLVSEPRVLEENHRRVKVTWTRGSHYETVYRNLMVEEGTKRLQWDDSETEVIGYLVVPDSQKEMGESGETTTLSFTQNAKETNRVAMNSKEEFRSSLIASGDYDVTVHNQLGWAKLKCSVPFDEIVDLGRIEMQLGGCIVGRVSLTDKLTYPIGIRITSEDGFELQQTLEGKHEEQYHFTGLSPGKWTVDLLDDRQPTHREVLKTESIKLVGCETATVDF